MVVAVANGVTMEAAATTTTAAADADVDSPKSVLEDEVIYSCKLPFQNLQVDTISFYLEDGRIL
jgi:hypothetical protein